MQGMAEFRILGRICSIEDIEGSAQVVISSGSCGLCGEQGSEHTIRNTVQCSAHTLAAARSSSVGDYVHVTGHIRQCGLAGQRYWTDMPYLIVDRFVVVQRGELDEGVTSIRLASIR